MQAVLGDTRGVGAQVFIGLRAAIATDDVDFGAGMAGGACQVEEHVEEVRIEMMHSAGEVIAQKYIQRGKGRGVVSGPVAVGDVQVLVRVGIKEAEAAFIR